MISSAQYDHLLIYWFVPVEPLFEWDCSYVCHELRAKKDGVYVQVIAN